MATMKVAHIPKAGANFEIIEREIPKPGPGHVRIRVQACGVCHSDVLTKEGGWPGLAYPRVPGHEVAGVIDDVGPGVTSWKTGQRVGVGWHGGQDGSCLACRRGDFVNCANLKVTGLSYDGGYQEYMIAPVEALARMPESLDPAEAAPLLCAGITTFNALRHSGARPSDLVAVQGIGGLGHLGIQFAQKFGYQVAAIGRGPENAALAKKLGASVYIDSIATDAATELQRLGGARAILATAPSAKAMSSLVDGLGKNGTMMVVGASTDPIEVTPVQLIFGNRSVRGWASGIPTDSEDTLRFAALIGRPADDRAVSPHAGGGRIRADAEREGGVSRRPHDVEGRRVERRTARAGGKRSVEMSGRCLEDFTVGQIFRAGPLPVHAERIKAFAAEFDPQPFHLDEHAARDTIFGGLAASGWHTAAMTMRLLVESDLRPAGGIVGAGFDEFRWPRPVRPGDALRIEAEVVEVRPSRSRPDQGVIKVRTTTLNQHDEAVQVTIGNLVVPRRPK